MALINRKADKFLRGAGSTVAKISMDQISARTMEARDRRLAEIAQSRQNTQNQFAVEQQARGFEQQQTLQEDRQAYDLEMSKLGGKGGIPADLVTHNSLVEYSKSDDPIVSRAARIALKMEEKPTSPEKREDMILGYVKIMSDLQKESMLAPGEEGYRTLEQMRDEAKKMMGYSKKEPTKAEKILFNHPQYGDITEAYIRALMKKHSKTREEVMARLGQDMPSSQSGSVIRE